MQNNTFKHFSIEQSIGCFGVVFLFISTITLGGAAGSFVDVPSFLITLGPTYFILLFIYGKDLFYYLKEALFALCGKTVKANTRYAEISVTGSRVVILVGVIATLIGLINLLHSYTNQEQLLPGIAVSILTTFYGLIVSQLIFFPLRKVFEKGTTLTEKKSSSILNIFITIVAFLLISIVIMFIMGLILEITGNTNPPRIEKIGDAEFKYCGKNSQVIFNNIQSNIQSDKGLFICSLDIVINVNQQDMLRFFEPREPYNRSGIQSQMKATISTILSQRTVKKLLTTKGKKDLALEIEKALNEILYQLTEGKVENIFFSKFLITNQK